MFRINSALIYGPLQVQEEMWIWQHCGATVQLYSVVIVEIQMEMPKVTVKI
jgi:hypothetical protein